MMELSNVVEDINHSGVVGNFRELFLSELIKPYLSPQMEIATGKIIDSYRNQSNQIDTIIYDSSIIPPALIIQGLSVIPVEAVLATIEVKSTLRLDDLKKSIENGLSVKNLSMHESVINEKLLSNIPSYIFAFKSDPDFLEKNKTERDRVIEKIKLVSEDKEKNKTYAPISGVCIADKNYIHFNYSNYLKKIHEGRNKKIWHKETLESSWVSIEKEPNSYENILHFMINFIDNIYLIRQQRRRISFSLYC